MGRSPKPKSSANIRTTFGLAALVWLADAGLKTSSDNNENRAPEDFILNGLAKGGQLESLLAP